MRWTSGRQMILIGLVSTFSLGVGTGCASDTTGPALRTPAQLSWQLVLNHHAITLSLTPPYNTIQLTTTAWSATGAPLTDTTPTVYSVDYSSAQCGCQSVTVSPTGVLASDGIDPDANVLIIATRQVGGVTLADTAIVNINDVSPGPPAKSLAMQLSIDSANVPASRGFLTASPVGVDSLGDTIPNVIVHVTSTTPQTVSVVYCFSGFCAFSVQHSHPGRTRLIADATIYGTTVTDTVLLTVAWPNWANVAILPTTGANGHTIGFFSHPDDTVGTGAMIAWINALSGQPADVVFDDPTNVQSADSVAFRHNFNNWVIPTQGGGNIAPWTTQIDTIGYYNGHVPQTVALARARTFPVPGTYPYHSTLYGTAGVIHVLPPFQVP